MSDGDRVLRDEARRRLNEKSTTWATRRRAPWTEEDDHIILTEWVAVPPAHRREMDIARRLNRTLYACQGRAEDLRDNHEGTPRTTPAPRPVCGTCFTELPASGQCDYCE
jgi:ferric-dicitrate binding protein FerR (iron transport regulator)